MTPYPAGKAGVYRAGKIQLSNLVNQDGNALTFKQLRVKYQ